MRWRGGHADYYRILRRTVQRVGLPPVSAAKPAVGFAIRYLARAFERGE
jgi:hypothetical protein